jgi:hypothetical protein
VHLEQLTHRNAEKVEVHKPQPAEKLKLGIKNWQDLEKIWGFFEFF